MKNKFPEFATRPAMVETLKNIEIHTVLLRAAQCFVIIDN